MSVVSTNNEAERPQSLARTRLGVTLSILDGSQSRSFLNSPRQRQAEFVLSLVPVIWEDGLAWEIPDFSGSEF